ncbi:MAG: NAD(P)H-dependent oxidoreductase subunit E [Burkholderiales bacterium]
MKQSDVVSIPLSDVKKRLKQVGKTKGRSVEPQAWEEIRQLLGAAPRRRDLLIEHLHLIQDKYQHISAPHLAALAAEMKLPQAEVYEVATFYHHFDVIKENEMVPPALTVRVCDSVSCHLAGADKLVEDLTATLGSGIRVQRVPCVGRCDTAPVVVVGQNPVDKATSQAVQTAVKQNKTKPTLPDYIQYHDYKKNGGYQLLRDCVAGKRDVEAVISEMEHAGLRGLGGAGFPTGKKWRIVRAEAAPKLMAVNIDEGEPGTFKDRYYLEKDPHRFLEGMLVAAWAVGIDEIYVYLRDEYAACREILERTIGALLVDPPCKVPVIHLRRGAGAYICGEESAMIESIEGKRGMPRLRPPYVAQVGLFGRPTLEHNMETLYWVRDIIELGAPWFASHGRNGRKGLRSFSVSGRVQKTGVHVAPAGITIRELIAEYCGGMLPGHELYGYLPGGASGGILPASLANVPLDFDTLTEYGCFIGSAAIVVFSRQDKARDISLNLLSFFKDESCGQCTPCRVGTDKSTHLLAEKKWNQPLIKELSQAMMDASICGLGQAAPNPMLSVMKYFSHEIN